MSTRSQIGYINENDEFVGIYCHYDGYPNHVGKILVEHHNSISAAEQLAVGSHIRNLDHDGTVVRYGDGDGGVEIYDNVEQALNSGFDYVYVYSTNDNCWKCYGHGGGIARNEVKEYQIPGNTRWESA